MGKILMVNLPFAGHTNPTLPLAKALVERGHTVTYINAPEWEDKIVATGAKFVPYINYPKDLSELKRRKLCFKAAYETVMAIGKDYDLLIYEMFFYLGKIAAERLHIPCIRQFSQCAWNNETARHASKLWHLSCKVLGKRMVNDKTAKLLGVEHINLIESVLTNNVALNIVYVPSVFQPYQKTFDTNYIFTCPVIDKNQTSTLKIPYEKLQKPVIYISLGSIISSKRLCQKFISAFGNKAVSVILNVGKNVKLETLKNLPPNIYAYNYVPQLEVLQHTDLFITHGGMNSVNEAIYYGVPMYVSPIANDQFINANRIQDLKVGQRFNVFTASAHKIYDEVMVLLEQQDIRENMKKLQKDVINEIKENSLVEKIDKIIVKCNIKTDISYYEGGD